MSRPSAWRLDHLDELGGAFDFYMDEDEARALAGVIRGRVVALYTLDAVMELLRPDYPDAVRHLKAILDAE